MSKSDAEMEDAEKLPSDSGNNVQDSTSEMVDANLDSKGEKVPCDPAVQGDVSTREGDEQALDESRNNDIEKTEVKAELKDQTDSEANEPLEGSVTGKINIKSENEELIDANAEAEAQTDTRNALERQCEPNKSELLEQNGTSGVIEENSTANGMDSGNYVNNVDEKNNQGVAEIKREHTGNEDANCVQPLVGGEKTTENIDPGIGDREHKSLPPEVAADEVHQRQNDELNEVRHGEDKEMEPAANLDRDTTVKDDLKKESNETGLASSETDGHAKTVETAIKHDGKDSSLANQHEAVTPISHIRHSPARAEDYSGETIKNVFTQATVPLMGESDDGTPEDQAAFMREIERFYRERAMEFKPPKFYGQPLNCLKLWRAVIRLGGYDRVTGSKLWRQVGESFHPPKTCTTVSWTFRIFYEKSLLEYERHKIQTGELQLPAATLPEASGVDGEGNGYQGSGSGRARRDAAARAMQGWHAQQHLGDGEDKDPNNMGKREKNLKSIGHKQKRPNEVEHSNKAARAESSKQLVTSVVDVGPPADWVKINVRRNKDCFEVYALVPGLLREEVRVQSDPAGRLVITGQPEQVDNPWGITPFKKVVSLPARIDPLQTSAVVSLHGRLFVRVPFERSNAKV